MGIISYIKEEIEVIKERDPAIKSTMEVFLYPTFHAILKYRLAHKLLSLIHIYMLVVGEKEEAEGKVSVRSRFLGDEGQKDLKDFITAICEEIRTKEIRKIEVQDQK